MQGKRGGPAGPPLRHTPADRQVSRMAKEETKRQELIGQRFGLLTVEGDSGQRKGRYTLWRCRCDCGGEVLAKRGQLLSGQVTSCGCVPGTRSKTVDLTGRRFGKLVCLAPTQERGPDGGVVWRCRCDCGNECLAISTQLTKGYKKSCGCLGRPPLKDYLHRRFGALEVVAYDGKRGGMHYWRCRCDCGGETVVSQSNLQSGHTTSCGCVQREMYRSNLKLVEGTSVAMLENRLKAPIKSNTSGCSGVYFHRKSGKWNAQITFKSRTYFLGSYRTFEDAVKARKRGEEMYDSFLDWYYNDYLKAGEA